MTKHPGNIVCLQAHVRQDTKKTASETNIVVRKPNEIPRKKESDHAASPLLYS